MDGPPQSSSSCNPSTEKCFRTCSRSFQGSGKKGCTQGSNSLLQKQSSWSQPTVLTKHPFHVHDFLLQHQLKASPFFATKEIGKMKKGNAVLVFHTYPLSEATLLVRRKWTGFWWPAPRSTNTGPCLLCWCIATDFKTAGGRGPSSLGILTSATLLHV